VPEPELDFDDIQGNILAGFNKDFQTFIFLRVGTSAANVTSARRWLRATLHPQLATTREVHDHNRAYSAARRAGTTLPTATWVNVAFSARGIARLLSQSVVDEFKDEAFKLGLFERSEFLGDPTDVGSPGNKRNWLYGGSAEREAHLVVIVASDILTSRNTTVQTLVDSLAAAGLETVVEPQHGATLSGSWSGHEHFGFKDGISQPGIRGRARGSSGDDGLITARTIHSSDPRAAHFGKPGQPLLWPGEFVLGHQRQFPFDISLPEPLGSDPLGPDPPTLPSPLPAPPAAPLTTTPSWAGNGSYLVIRRLRQNFSAFWAFARQQAALEGITPEAFGARLVGRWQSGAPIMRAPFADNQTLADNDFANNHFAFNRDTRPAPPDPAVSPANTDPFDHARSDFLGAVCPRFAHIRKINPRDGATDLGVAHDTLTRMILRRGIPYGERVIGVSNPSPELLAADRGLIFACYQSSIVNQFETLIRRWANTPNQPTPGGHDPIIGQAHSHQTGRQRFLDLPSGRRCFLDRDWITPTGGGYFFSPSLSAVRNVLGQT